jgi:hypothetical protein
MPLANAQSGFLRQFVVRTIRSLAIIGAVGIVVVSVRLGRFSIPDIEQVAYRNRTLILVVLGLILVRNFLVARARASADSDKQP